MMQIDFTADDGSRASLQVCLVTTAGEKNKIGASVFNAILACCHMRSATTQTVPNVPVYKEKQTVDRFMDLLGKPIGLLLRCKKEPGKNGKMYTKAEIVTPFDPQTRQTARELLEKQEAKMLDKLLARELRAAERRAAEPAAETNPAIEQFESPERSAPADINEEIPF